MALFLFTGEAKTDPPYNEIIREEFKDDKGISYFKPSTEFDPGPLRIKDSANTMRKVILNLAVSLDGYIEGPNGEFDWCFGDQDYGMTAFMKRIDAVFLGRKSYELTMKMNEKNPYPNIATYVFSNTLKELKGDARIVSGDIEKEVKTIQNRKGNDIWLFGGASLVTSFVNAGLVDELQLAVHPLLLGSGKSLFQGIEGRIFYELINTKTYSTGLVQLFYERKKH